MASDGLAEAFARLLTSDSRLNALEALVKELTPYEWRFIQSLTNTRTFQFDVIGRLPVELVSHIFSYLDTSTPWRLQHVSQIWYERLRSLSVLKPSLDSWYDGTVDLKGVDLDFCWRKARSIHAFRRGPRQAPPDSSFKISTSFGLTQHMLVGDNLIWLAQDRRQVNLVNLRSSISRKLVDPSRGEIGNLYAADDLVAFSARLRRIIFVSELNGQGQVKSFRLHSSSQKLALTCRHRTVACAVHLKDHTFVYIWNYDTQQGRSFNINRATLQIPMSNPDKQGLLLQPNTETVLLCQLVSSTSRSDASRTELLHWRFTYAGECCYSAKQVLDGYDEVSDVVTGDSSSMNFIPASHDGLFLLQRSAWKFAFFASTVRALQFDEKAHAFTSPQHPRLISADASDEGNVVWWKDTFVEAGTKEQIIAHRGTVSAPRADPDMAYSPMEGEPATIREWQIGYKDLLINDRYIIRPYCDAYYVFCYDHTVQLLATKGSLHGVGPWEVIEPEFPNVSECISETDGTP